MKDLDSDKSVMSNFYSGVSPGNAIEPGVYDILEGAHGKYRLEPVDSHYGDDATDDGHDFYRLHGPGRSWGCITACSTADWKGVHDLLNKTITGTREVYKNWGVQPFNGVSIRIPRTEQETLKYYGHLVVQ